MQCKAMINYTRNNNSTTGISIYHMTMIWFDLYYTVYQHAFSYWNQLVRIIEKIIEWGEGGNYSNQNRYPKYAGNSDYRCCESNTNMIHPDDTCYKVVVYILPYI